MAIYEGSSTVASNRMVVNHTQPYSLELRLELQFLELLPWNYIYLLVIS